MEVACLRPLALTAIHETYKSFDGSLRYTRRCCANTLNKQVALKLTPSLRTKNVRRVSGWHDGIEDSHTKMAINIYQ